LELALFDNLGRFDGIRHAVTMREQGEPAEFSMAYHTGEHPSFIRKNRKKLQDYFGDETRFVSPLQVHGDKIYAVSHRESRGWEYLDESLRVDALVTNVAGVAISILTADCVPLLLYDPVAGVIGAVHAGWQGSRLKIAAKTVIRMNDLYGSQPSDIIVGIGPAIGGCCYEVSKDVAAHFWEYGDAVASKSGDKYLLDLKLVNSIQLQDLGVAEKNIEISRYCTSCSVDRFFSYRKENKTNGRFISTISIAK